MLNSTNLNILDIRLAHRKVLNEFEKYKAYLMNPDLPFLEMVDLTSMCLEGGEYDAFLSLFADSTTFSYFTFTGSICGVEIMDLTSMKSTSEEKTVKIYEGSLDGPCHTISKKSAVKRFFQAAIHSDVVRMDHHSKMVLKKLGMSIN